MEAEIDYGLFLAPKIYFYEGIKYDGSKIIKNH